MTYSMKLMHSGRIVRVPVALRVCRDSRYVAMKRYHLAFPVFLDDNYKTHKKRWDVCVSEGKRTWFDFENDMLFADMTRQDGSPKGPVRLLLEYCPAEVGKIRRLAISC